MTTLPATITETASYKTLFDARESAADIARNAQAEFRRTKIILLVAGALASICGGLLLYISELDPSVKHLLRHLAEDPYKTILVVLQAAFLGAVAYCTFLLTNRNFTERWRVNRLRAEALRMQLQKHVLELGHAAGLAAFNAAGAHFEAFVEDQRKYLTQRRAKARRSHGLAASYGAAIAAIIAVAGALSGLDNALVLATIGLIGVAAPAAAVAVQSWTEATAEAKREQLHAATEVELVRVMAESQRLSDAITAEDLPSALAFAERVFEVLRKDHQAFADLFGD